MGVVYFDLDVSYRAFKTAGLFLGGAVSNPGGLSSIGESVRSAAAAARERDAGLAPPGHGHSFRTPTTPPHLTRLNSSPHVFLS